MANSGIDVANLQTSWQQFAHTYDHRLGGSTFAVAEHILAAVASPQKNSLTLDNSCGTGAFTVELQKKFPGTPVRAVDNSPGMINIMHGLIEQHGWQDHVTTEVMDAQHLTFPDDTFDLSVNNFGIFFYPNPVQGAREIIFIPILFAVQEIIQPAKIVVLQMLEKWRKRETLEDTMKDGGFANLEMLSQDVMIVQRNIEDLVGGLDIHLQDMVGGEWSGEEKAKVKGAVNSVLTAQREEYVVDLKGGKVGLRMQAWIALGKK